MAETCQPSQCSAELTTVISDTFGSLKPDLRTTLCDFVAVKLVSSSAKVVHNSIVLAVGFL